MDLIIAFALGAGVVIAGKRGRHMLHRTIRWGADAAGWISGRASQALDEARAIARDEFERTRTEGSSRATADASSTNGVPMASKGETV
jgi:hypothetical protein